MTDRIHIQRTYIRHKSMYYAGPSAVLEGTNMKQQSPSSPTLKSRLTVSHVKSRPYLQIVILGWSDFDAMLASALAARDSLLSCGQCLFRSGTAEEIGSYTSGVQSLCGLIKRLQASTPEILSELSWVNDLLSKYQGTGTIHRYHGVQHQYDSYNSLQNQNT